MFRRISFRKVFIAATFFVGITPAQARVQMQVSVEPQRSRMGEPVRYKIRVESDSGTIQAPKLAPFKDFEVLDRYESRSGGAVIINGRFTQTRRAEFTYILKPLKKGVLTIPGVQLQVGNETKSTVATNVTVDNLPGGVAQRPRLGPNASPPPRAQPNPFANPSDPFADVDPNDPFAAPPSQPFGSPLPQQRYGGGPSGPTNPKLPQAALEDPLPPGQTFFLRAEPDKRTAFVGELVTVSYALYQRAPLRLEDPTFAKFPDFKGFLKEELEMPRKFVPIPTEILGETLNRSELLKYALFPLKPGQVTVQPLIFKATVFPSQADILNSIMNGTIPPDMGNGIPMEKSSQEIRMTIKPLPIAPQGTPFSGAVGQFEIEMRGPAADAKLAVDQPFTVTLTIAGLGNVKAIEEPVLDLPKTIETHQSKNQYEFRPDATGFKSFEYLLLPRAAGKLTIPPLSWGYFDPATEQFKMLQTQPLELTIEGSNGAVAAKENEKDKKVVEQFGPWVSGEQDFIAVNRIGAPSPASGPVGWGAQLIAYIAAAGVFLRRRRSENAAKFYANSPWAKTERLILGQKEWDNKELAILVDQWIRERLWELLRSNPLGTQLNTESSRDEFLDVLRSQLHPEHHRHLAAIQKLWSDLDILRFTGAKSQRTQGRAFLDQARRAADPIVKALPPPAVPASA